MVGESKPEVPWQQLSSTQLFSQMQTSCQLPELVFVFEIRAIWPPSKGKNHISIYHNFMAPQVKLTPNPNMK